MRRISLTTTILPAAVVALLFCACSGGGVSPVPQGAASLVRAIHRNGSSSKIQHIVIIVQENRSLNDLFYGFPGAKTAKFGLDTKGLEISLKPVGLETTCDIEHDLNGFLTSCDGKGTYPGTDCRMDGFDREYWGCGGKYSYTPCPNANPPYSYVPQSETKPYFYLGRNYVLADEMFASNLDESSFISHQYIIAGQANSAVNFPDSWWGCPGGSSDEIGTLTQERQYGSNIPMCWNNETLGAEMDDAGLPWAFYTSTYNGDGGIWSAYQNINHIYNGPDWSNVILNQAQILTDITSGNLPTVSWVVPDILESDHPNGTDGSGPSWVASIVNTIGASSYWPNTAIFITWDEWGGWYDHVAPPLPFFHDSELGFRVPLVIVSPYAKQAYVSHVQHDFGSILKFIEGVFNLGLINGAEYADSRADDLSDCFNFTKKARAFKKIPAPYDATFFIHKPQNTDDIDDD